MPTILLSIGIIALCIIMLGVKVFFVKGGKVPVGTHSRQPGDEEAQYPLR